MARYEMIAILSPDLETDQIDEAIEKIKLTISNSGGTEAEAELQGRKRLAFPIRDHLDGNVVLSKFEIDPGKVHDIGVVLRQDERCLRNMVVRT